MSSSDDSSVPDELNSDYSSDGPLGMQEEGEDDYDDELVSGDESGENEMSGEEDDTNKPRRDSTAVEEGDDDMIDEDHIATNIEEKRE